MTCQTRKWTNDISVKPLAPSKPQVTSYTENSVTLSWTISTAIAHRPILRYSILISHLEGENMRVFSTKSNATTAVISDLQPYTRYSFAVRAENAAGHSEFGQETVFRTLGEPPTTAPVITSITNGTDGCVEVEWRAPPITNGQIVGYRIMVHKVGNGAMREWYLKGNKQSLCGLAYFSEFMLSMEADNGFGYSPSATVKFLTDQKTPEGPPEMIQLRPLGSDAVMVSWHEPLVTNGIITTYLIHYKESNGQKPYKTIRLLVKSDENSKSFSYNVTKLSKLYQFVIFIKVLLLEPFVNYKFLLSAATEKGEGPKSSPATITTDHVIPAVPQIVNITYECDKDVTVNWIPMSAPVSFYRVIVESTDKPSVYNTTEKKINLGGLSSNLKYVVQVSSVLRSIFDNGTVLESNFSAPEVFEIKANCHLQSSICSNFNQNCVPISTQGKAEGSSLSFTIIFFGIFFIACIGTVFICMLKR